MAHLKTGGVLFSYEVELRNGSVVIGGLLGGAETELRGARIIAVNGEPTDELTSKLLTRIHGETPLFRGFVALFGKRRNFLETPLCPSNWTGLSCQRIKLVGEWHFIGAIGSELALADHVHELDAGEHAAGRAE